MKFLPTPDTLVDMSDSTPPQPADISKVLVTREQIAMRIEQLAEELVRFYEGRELTVLVVLTGALVFVSDLVRKMPLKVRIEPVSVHSYPGRATRSCGVQWRLPPPENLTGRNVLIADDIFDSGETMRFLLAAVASAGAEHVRSCCLLQKNRPDLGEHGSADFVGFQIPDEFVVGYGLDFDGLYRNLPDIGVLAEHAREPGA